MKILMVLTSHRQLGQTGEKTGFWLEEFAAPYYLFKDAGAEITLASPRGGQPPLDPKSDAPDAQTDATRRFKSDAAAQAVLANTVKLATVSAVDFDAIFYPGGHGPLWDLAEDVSSIALIETMLAAGKPVAAVCHAPGVLRHAKTPDGKPVVLGKTVTGFSNNEEQALGLIAVVPFLVEDMLLERGALYTSLADWQPNVATDGLLITGQNPASSALAAQTLLEMLAQVSVKQADPQMQAVLDQLSALGGKPPETLSPAEARQQPSPADAVTALLKKRGDDSAPEPIGKVEDQMIAGAAGQIPARIYTPQGTGPFPVVLYIHGGGWVIATIDTYDSSARALANAASALVVSIEYRKGPEHKFPAAHEDAFAAYKWTLANAAKLNGDPQRIAVVGESAGGNLAANVSMMARDHKVQMPVYQVLIYPVANNDLYSASMKENADAKPLYPAMLPWFLGHYLNNPTESSDPRIALVNADLQGLPPTTLITAELDPLRTEGEMLAAKLTEAGVRVDYRNYVGVAHEFFGMGAAVDKAKQAVAQAAEGLLRGFSVKAKTSRP